jgi:hypothetical protein
MSRPQVLLVALAALAVFATLPLCKGERGTLLLLLFKLWFN